MYGWMWRRLPGPLPVRLLLVLALAAVVVAVCFGWLFPIVDRAWLEPAQTIR